MARAWAFHNQTFIAHIVFGQHVLAQIEQIVRKPIQISRYLQDSVLESSLLW